MLILKTKENKMNYISQYLQDKYIDDFFNKKENGIFIDIGAGDGMDINNTLFLERERKWTGLCVEPHPNNFAKIIKNRTCVCENYAIDIEEGQSQFMALEGYPLGLSGLVKHYNQQHKARIEHEVNAFASNQQHNKLMVNCISLQKLLDKHNITYADFCSIDVEGAELNVLKSIDFSKTKIKTFCIENNYNTTEVADYLRQFGYSNPVKLSGDEFFSI